MSGEKFTPGPWRWEFSKEGKRLSLCGGAKPYDLTVMDFERYGMYSAIPRFRDPAHDGMQLLYRLHEREDWIAPFEGRAHHAKWCSGVVHPDAILMEAAPDLYEAVSLASRHAKRWPHSWNEADVAVLENALAKARGDHET